MAEVKEKTKKKFKVLIDEGLCKGCGLCVAYCPKNCLRLDEMKGKAVIDDHDCCIGCLLCELRCPDFAIDVIEVKGD